MRLAFLAALALVWTAESAQAAERVTPTAADGARMLLAKNPVATPTFHCIGIVSAYAGDGNANSECVPRYRVRGEATWQMGHPFYADRGDREFRGSIREE